MSCQESKYHINEMALIERDSLKTIELNFEQNSIDFEMELLKSIGVDSICDGSELVALPLDLETNEFEKTAKAVKIPVIFYNDCRDENKPIELRIRYDFDLFFNKDGQILVNGKKVNVQKDSIIKGFKEIWKNKEINFENFKYSEFRLIGTSNLESTLNMPIKIILKSYMEFHLQKINEFCEMEYNNSIQELSKVQINRLKQDFPFMIHLSYVDNIPSFFPFPPPPILIND
jgi:hypothetical protein